MAEFDLPAMIKYVINATGHHRIIYIGYSQGSLIGFAGFSIDQKLAKKVSDFWCFSKISKS